MSPEVPIIILIIAVPTYFICKWIIKRFGIGTEKNQKLIALIPTIILSPVIYVSLITIWVFSMSYYPTTNFDKTDWNSNIEERYKMSEDIIESKMLIGKTRAEAIQILGTDFSADNENRITYYLGFVPAMFNIDPDYLVITLKNGIVVGVKQYSG